jgi:Pentapeptide repeats (8 copies)
LAALLTAQAQTQFEWLDASENVRSLSDLEEILREHRQWWESKGKAGTRANLAGAYLRGANLTGANLTNANLYRAKLADAWVYTANFNRALFEPDSLPKLIGISDAENLELLTYWFNPAALVQLRKQFEDGGLREQERKITYALKRREAELSWARGTSRTFPTGKGTRAILWSSDSILANFTSFTLNKVFFDWTCQYGMSPGRPLILEVVLWFLCSFLYFACIQTPGEAGLYRVYGQSIGDDPSAQGRVERISPLSTKHSPGPRWLFQFFRRECLLLRTSMFFSLMSAFNIGFRDINFGRWLRLLTRQDFDIKPVGWARVIAGWQSLISVYLIALWVLTYFGRPFD